MLFSRIKCRKKYKQMDYYIYYKSKEEDAHLVIACVQQLALLIAPHLNTKIQLQRRPQAVDGIVTWMEIYPDAPQHFERILSDAVNQSELSKYIVSERHIECFEAIYTSP